MLHKTMNRTCRAVLDIKDITHPALEMYELLKWLPIEKQFLLNLGCEMFKCINNLNNYGLVFPNTHSDIHNYPTRNNIQFALPTVNNSSDTKTLYYRGANLWNSIPICIKDVPSFHIFKKKL